MNPQQTNTMLTSVPNSLRAQLERAQNLLTQSEHAEAHGDHSLAVVKARKGVQVLRTIATSFPELAALALIAEMATRLWARSDQSGRGPDRSLELTK